MDVCYQYKITFQRASICGYSFYGMGERISYYEFYYSQNDVPCCYKEIVGVDLIAVWKIK